MSDAILPLLGMVVFMGLWLRASYKQGLAELELAAFKCGVRLQRLFEEKLASTGKGDTKE